MNGKQTVLGTMSPRELFVYELAKFNATQSSAMEALLDGYLGLCRTSSMVPIDAQTVEALMMGLPSEDLAQCFWFEHSSDLVYESMMKSYARIRDQIILSMGLGARRT